MIITILGTSANQYCGRECVSILADFDNSSVLFDAGPGIIQSLQKIQRHAYEVNSVILTHIHGDHILGFPYFIYNRRQEINSLTQAGHCSDLTVCGYEDTLTVAKETLKFTYPQMKLPFSVNYVTLKETDTIQVSNHCTIKILPAKHTVPTFSCVMNELGKKVVYTSDTMLNDALLDLSSNADIIIHDCMYASNLSAARKTGHSTAIQAGIFAAKANAQCLVLVHYKLDDSVNLMSLLTEASSEFNCLVSLPYDGSMYSI